MLKSTTIVELDVFCCCSEHFTNSISMYYFHYDSLSQDKSGGGNACCLA